MANAMQCNLLAVISIHIIFKSIYYSGEVKEKKKGWCVFGVEEQVFPLFCFILLPIFFFSLFFLKLLDKLLTKNTSFSFQIYYIFYTIRRIYVRLFSFYLLVLGCYFVYFMVWFYFYSAITFTN